HHTDDHEGHASHSNGEHKHHDHGGSDHHGHGHHDHGDMVSDFKKRLYISLIFTIPILILSPMIQGFIGVEWGFTSDPCFLCGRSTLLFFYVRWTFITGVVSELKDKNPCMMTLIGLAILVAYDYRSMTIFGWEGKDFFWELATLIDIMLLGHWIEMRSVMGA